jgi:hypothetical protein
MLCEPYIEALLVDANQADAVWRAWKSGLIKDAEAAQAWLEMAEQQRACGPHP